MKVKECWVVTPVVKNICIFVMENRKYKLVQEANGNDLAKSRVLDGFEAGLTDIF